MDNTRAVSSQNVKDESLISTFLTNGKLILILGVVFGIILAVVINEFLMNRPYTYQGSLIDPPLQAPDFQINDQNGNAFRLSQQEGKVVLLFFGYTHCPDVCPLTLYDYKRIREALGERSNDVRFVFITVDPERDTPETLKIYLRNFDQEIVGLSEDRSMMENVWNDYDVSQIIREVDGAAGYMVDHTARVYVIDKSGFLRMTYPFGYDVEKIVEDITHLLSEDES
jgi:protein SCO1